MADRSLRVCVHRGSPTQYSTVSTATGSHTISSVNAGMYEVIIDAAGFKKFTRSGIQVQVAETARIDVVIEVLR